MVDIPKGVSLTPKNNCPKCGYIIDAAMPADESSASPTKGDISLCLECGQPLVYEDDLSIREMSTTEFNKLKWNQPNVYRQLTQAFRQLKTSKKQDR